MWSPRPFSACLRLNWGRFGDGISPQWQCHLGFLFLRVDCINSHLKESTRENETKVEQISKKVNSIEDRLSRMEEYTIQILDMLANIQEPLPSAGGEREDATVESDTWSIGSGGQEAFTPKGAPKRMYSRMMSVPAYVHRIQAGSSSSLRSTPMYFRHKLPNSNPYPSWYRQVSKSNWHRKSVQKAIRKFKRSNTLPSLDEPFTSPDSRSADESRLLSRIPPKQLPLRRSDSEGAAQSQGVLHILGLDSQEKGLP